MIKFNDKEQSIIDSVLYSNKNIFLHGPAGTGKSTIINEIVRRLELHEIKTYCITATTGAAAVNIKGTTLHRFSGIGIGTDTKEKLVNKINKKPGNKRKWKRTELLIIDEISMLGGGLFDKLNFIAKSIRKNSNPFGGIQLLITGDLLQLPPIKDNWIFQSESWKEMNFKIINLTECKRYKDNEYFNLLLRIRECKHTLDDINLLKKYVRNIDKTEDIEPTILYSNRIDVDEYNMKKLNDIKEEEFVYEAQDSIYSSHGVLLDECDHILEIYAKILNDAIPYEISLKKGAQVMLKKNIDPELELINGSRGVILDIHKDYIKVKFKNNKIVHITAEDWIFEDDQYKIVRSQIPLILAYSLTIHKSQGSTLDHVLCNLGSSIFANSQAYVALSRVKDLSGLYIKDFDEKCFKIDPDVVEFLK